MQNVAGLHIAPNNIALGCMNAQYSFKQIIEINKEYILKLSITDYNKSVILKKQRENRLQIKNKKSEYEKLKREKG